MGKMRKNKLIDTYKNMPIKKALIWTVIVSLSIALILSFIVLVLSRPSYYYFSSAGKQTALLWHNIVTFSSMFLCIVIAIAGGVGFFFKRKLLLPIQTLMNGTEQIAEKNLDFLIDYQSNDEFGRLCGSFNKMREELLNNNKTMWRMAEDRKKINTAFAHDLRTPLTVLDGYTDFLEDYIPSVNKKDEKLLETNRLMAHYIKRMKVYVELMTTIQKLEDTPVQRQTTPTEQFVEMLRDNIYLVADDYQKKIVLINEVAELNLNIDTALFFRVIENIAQNAFQHAENEVIMRLFLEDEVLYVEVIDDGRGFSSEALKQALLPFYQSKASNASHFGLGLSICKILCEKHGGTIFISNMKESGGKVTVSFSLTTYRDSVN